MTEKNLFLYNFAAVSFMKNTSAHVKEWLDYHLLAGVDHFYIYDNDSLDNLEKNLQPYIDAGIVTYIFYSGGNKKIAAYNDAVKNFKFECRYMAFLDCEEYLLPRKNQSVVEVTDEILSGKDNVGGVELNSYSYNANGQAIDAIEGSLLDNLKRRGRKAFEISNTIVNPRKVDFIFNTRYATYFDGILRLNEYSGKVIDDTFTVSEKIVVNSYKPETEKPNDDSKPVDTSKFILSSFYRSNIFDDSIVTYRDSRRANLPNADIVEVFGGKVDDGKLLATLAKTLLPSFDEVDAVEYFKSADNQLKYFHGISEFYISAPDEFFNGKLETFLTSFNVALRLQKNLLDETAGKFFVDAALNAIVQTLCTEFSSADAYLFIRELPKILPLSYATVEPLKSICAGMLESMKDVLQRSSDEKKNRDIDEDEMATWRKITELDNLEKFLAIFDVKVKV